MTFEQCVFIINHSIVKDIHMPSHYCTAMYVCILAVIIELFCYTPIATNQFKDLGTKIS